MEKDIAIKVEGISKTFRIPHEKISSLRGAFVNMFRSNGFEEFKALDNVSFEVKKGEFFGIIGRNGSGKSTLLKILAGIYQPDGGKIKIHGRISPFLELGIGFNPELSGRDNIYLNAAVLGLTHKQIDEKFDDIVNFSELRRFIDQKVKNYSSGMQVRLMFSTAVHANREILLMDEVLAVGDVNFQAKCLNVFNKYREQGKTVVLVTHDIETIQRYCNRALLLRNGQIIKLGKADEVGNAYIHQNISDQGKEIIKEEKGKEKREVSLGKKIVEIKKIELLDSKGNPVNTIKTHDKLEIKIYFDAAENFREKLNIGVSIENGEGQYLLGYNTLMDDYSPQISKGQVSIVYSDVLLLSGSYFINATIAKKDDGSTLDYQPRIRSFSVFSIGKENLYKGNFSLKHEWIQ